MERGTSLDDGARFHGGGPVPRGGKRRGNRLGSVQRELLASLREEGLPKWAVGNFSFFFSFSFLPSSHGFRDEAYGGGRKEDEDPFFFSRMAATAF